MAGGASSVPQPAAAPHTRSADSHSSWVRFVLDNVRVKTNLCSRQHWEHGYQLLPRTVPDYNFIYVTRGRVVWEIGGHPHRLQPGDLVLVPPRIPHRGWSETQRMTLVSVHVDALLPGGQDAFRLLRPPVFLRVLPRSRLDRYLRGALGEFERTDSADTMRMLPGWARLITLEFIAEVARRCLVSPRPRDPLVAGVLEQLSRWVTEPVTLAQLAAHAGYSPQHLNRRFQRELGVTPLKYLMRLRLERAARLLTETQLTATAIAQSLGFDDPAYFARAFKRHFGLSPQRYRTTVGSEIAS